MSLAEAMRRILMEIWAAGGSWDTSGDCDEWVRGEASGLEARIRIILVSRGWNWNMGEGID
jgi:hypothetical protein